MGTRAITLFQAQEYDEKRRVNMAWLFRRFDGYPKVHGNDLKKILQNRKFYTITEVITAVLNGLIPNLREASELHKSNAVATMNLCTEAQACDSGCEFVYRVFLDYGQNSIGSADFPYGVILHAFKPDTNRPLKVRKKLYLGPIENYAPTEPQ